MNITGQSPGEAKNSNGEVIGWFWLLIDPDRSHGHVVCRGKDSSFPQVAHVSVSLDFNKNMVLVISGSEYLEREYQIPEGGKLPVGFSAQVEVSPGDDPESFKGIWRSGDSSGEVSFRKNSIGGQTQAHQTFTDWESFKGWANKYASQPDCAFRGQGARHRLCTTFHRTGRVDLIRYIREDLPKFADRVETELDKKYDLNAPGDMGAVLGLAQHYGFPTPLLDWTSSPYVAAYFAFAEVVSQRNPESHVRIFRLASDFVRGGLSKAMIQSIDPLPTVSAYLPPSRGNGRLLNQQGLFTFANVVDVEQRLRFIEQTEKLNPGSLIEVVDISSDQARRGLADLRNMGTTSATLFPGLDGVATFLKHKQFYAPK